MGKSKFVSVIKEPPWHKVIHKAEVYNETFVTLTPDQGELSPSQPGRYT